MMPGWTNRDTIGLIFLFMGLGHLFVAFRRIDKHDPVGVLVEVLFAALFCALGILLIAIPPS